MCVLISKHSSMNCSESLGGSRVHKHTAWMHTRILIALIYSFQNNELWIKIHFDFLACCLTPVYNIMDGLWKLVHETHGTNNISWTFSTQSIFIYFFYVRETTSTTPLWLCFDGVHVYVNNRVLCVIPHFFAMFFVNFCCIKVLTFIPIINTLWLMI